MKTTIKLSSIKSIVIQPAKFAIDISITLLGAVMGTIPLDREIARKIADVIEKAAYQVEEEAPYSFIFDNGNVMKITPMGRGHGVAIGLQGLGAINLTFDQCEIVTDAIEHDRVQKTRAAA